MAEQWKKCENEAGFPFYVREEPAAKRWSHPAFDEILEKVNRSSNVKYATYRMAYKIKILQENIKVPNIRIVSGVFAHHCLSISESSFVLEPCELEAILTDIYFAAQKEGSFEGDVDTASEIALSFLLNIYDSERSSSVSIQAAKTALVMLSDDPNREKWRFLFSTMADHNGCISPRRLTSLLTQIALLAEYISEKTNFGQHLVQSEVDKCFAKTPGMLGLSEHGLFQWLESSTPPSLLLWMDVRVRLQETAKQQDNQVVNNIDVTVWKCSICDKKNPMGLKFKCTRCWGMMICEKCYLYNETKSTIGSAVYRHKKSHVVKEIIDPQGMPSQCIMGFVKSMKKILNCPTHCRRGHNFSADVQFPLDANKDRGEVSSVPIIADNKESKVTKIEVNKHRVYTSTVGKAKGKNISDPKIVLQDIIAQLESQNRALKNISDVFQDVQNMNSVDRRIQHKVDNHWGQIATQINRLKIFKENLLPGFQTPITEWENNPVADVSHVQNRTIINRKDTNVPPFEPFSPIPIMPKDCINESTVMEHKNIKNVHAKSVNVSDKNLMKNENAYKTPDSISNVSMSDISTWFGTDMESDRGSKEKSAAKHSKTNKSLLYPNRVGSTTSEDKFNADIESVATSNNKMKELNADIDSVLDRLQTILTNKFELDEMNFDNSQLQETANEMEGLLGTLIRGVEQRRTIKGDKI